MNTDTDFVLASADVCLENWNVSRVGRDEAGRAMPVSTVDSLSIASDFTSFQRFIFKRRNLNPNVDFNARRRDVIPAFRLRHMITAAVLKRH